MKGRLGKRLIRTGWIVLILLVLSGVAVGLYYLLPEPPEDEFRIAREAIATARDAEADRYAKELFRDACADYDSAMANWKRQNQRFIFRRDFTKALQLVSSASEKARRSAREALDKAAKVSHSTGATVNQLENQISIFEKLYAPLPIPQKTREHFNRAKMLLSEAKIARGKAEFHTAEEKLGQAVQLFDQSNLQAREMMESYFDSYPKWKSWVEQAIATSRRQNSEVIVVDKMAQECLLYAGGDLKRKFKVEFGPNWIGNKEYKGDQATPEGNYYVVQKKDRRRTIYHKALLLNYPNQDDRVRYKKNIAEGKFSAQTDIGGLIEIHGHGGRDFHWTNGCVALTNSDMDVLFRMVSVNTPVTIVGSLKTLQNWMEDELAK
ncbi:MAG TPA: L,D-transpeptidase [Prolixibacteraceae bacterium]|nr:L,D-transpeptidase [Prolixibacteraceae bacterium]